MTETQSPKWSYSVTYVDGTTDTFPSDDDHLVESKVFDGYTVFTDSDGEQTHVRREAIVKIRRVPYFDEGATVMTSRYYGD